ncbi:unnamed protein product [Pleuronectes platessa]|uniref:Uncharacterized protein n=1 Tax=Pleuronectes platessa TaxID=8262 RepID=A0A9N7U1N4_PLEPL|nr:unnamed protein product [Pleuronectes platessa]
MQAIMSPATTACLPVSGPEMPDETQRGVKPRLRQNLLYYFCTYQALFFHNRISAPRSLSLMGHNMNEATLYRMCDAPYNFQVNQPECPAVGPKHVHCTVASCNESFVVIFIIVSNGSFNPPLDDDLLSVCGRRRRKRAGKKRGKAKESK